MIKILHLLKTNSFSGAENVAITIIQNINKNSDFKCIYVSEEGPIEQVLIEQKIPYILVNQVSRKNIKKLVRTEKPDLIHCHDFTTSILAASVCNKIPLISHLHNNPLWIKKICLKSIVYGATVKRYKIVLAVSKAVFDEFIFSNRIRVKKVIGNPLSMSNVRDSLKNVVDIKKDFDIIFLGRLSEQKKPIRFINIISQLKKKKNDIKAVMVGDGELRERCEEQVKELNLEDNIKILGFKKERFDYISKSKILCMTSAWEGFGLVAFEALCLDKPVVCTNVGGLVNIVDKNCGKLCNTDDDFVMELWKLLNDREYYKLKSIGAYNRANELDNLSDYTDEMKRIYQMYVK